MAQRPRRDHAGAIVCVAHCASPVVSIAIAGHTASAREPPGAKTTNNAGVQAPLLGRKLSAFFLLN
jgi:hypothetical protein